MPGDRYNVCNRMGEDAPGAERIPLIKRRFLGLHGVIDIRAFLSGWFHGAPFEVLAARTTGTDPTQLRTFAA